MEHFTNNKNNRITFQKALAIMAMVFGHALCGLEAEAQSALDQIDSKKYYGPYRSIQRQVIKVGAYSDVSERTLEDWKVEEIE